ncbi:MAG: hypothetical protein ACR2PX_19885 [Endozoicomonas sp.]|uniref:capsular polysaccharide export protein, LipB/KpsS family n=1 Tax=Endozoicomonas sp. TaxID=1892382 RepID=UPI003D9B7FF0
MRVLLYSTSHRLDEYYQSIADNVSEHLKCDVFKFDQKLPNPDFKYLSLCLHLDLEKIIDFKVRYKGIMKGNEKVSKIKAEKYKLGCLINSLKIFRLIKSGGYDLVVVWNGSRMTQRLVSEVAKMMGVSVAYMENGIIPRTTVADGKGVNFNNSVPRSRSFYEANHFEFNIDKKWGLSTRRQAEGVEKVDSKKQIDGKYIFFPFQVDSDSQIINHSKWLRNMREFFVIALRTHKIIDDKNIRFVFKEHPSSPFEYRDLEKDQTDRCFFVNNLSTEMLIRGAEAVVTVNSTVGIEALIYGKKVITIGDAFYNIDGLVNHADSEVELASIINGLDDWGVNESLRQSFLGYLANIYSIPGSWTTPDYKHFEKLEKTFIQIEMGK